jgi:EAL domain-containing protein (putative c-di-GMP-specific phosphodiesterase class I)
LESGLRAALERRQLQLHYQPQIDARSGRVVGVEALARWNHPEWGQVPPSQFIPVAEDSGLIIPIGRWVLEEACRQNHAWQQAGIPAIRVGVNLSALQFRQSDFQEVVRAALILSKLPPHCLELELTESILMRDVAQNNTDLLALSELGVQFAVDDFGTGYSSLSYLKRFPIDRLKVDRSFIRNVTTDANDAAIVRAVISLAHSMQMSVIAEGVETREQFDFLLAEGCDQVQGYYFARPMAAEQLLPLLRSGNPPDFGASPPTTEHAAGEHRAPALRH